MSSDNQNLPAPGNGGNGPEAKPGLLGRISGWFDSAVQEGRGGSRAAAPLRTPPPEAPQRPAEPGGRRSRNAAHGKMVIPAEAVVSGSLDSSGDADIAGRVEGDVTLKAHLTLFKPASVTGSVSAGSCQVDGTVEGPVKCAGNLSVGAPGRINADIHAGGDVDIAGCVTGCVSAAGRLRLATGCVVNGDVRAGVLVMEEGAALNGLCSMLRPARDAAAGAPEGKQGD